MAETIRYARLGQEDINFGEGTFEVRLADGRVVTLNKVDLGVILSDAALSTRDVTLDSLTVTTLNPVTVAPTTTLRVPEKADPGVLASGELWINSGGTVLEYADDAGTPAQHALVANDTTQTLTNKTLTDPAISSPVLSGTVTGTYTLGGTPTLGSTLALDGNDLTDIDEIALNDAAANPTSAGKLRRSGNELGWRVTTGSMRVFYGEAGTIMLFQQTSAPTGWTKLVSHNDKVLRVVSGAASSGGTVAFSTFAATAVTGAHTLTIAELASHPHNQQINQTNVSGLGMQTATPEFNATPTSTNQPLTTSTGGGGAHDHTLNLDVQYVDLILASKD